MKRIYSFKVKLIPVAPLSGRAIDESGNAVAHAVVHIHSDVPFAKADGEGKFELKAAFADRDFELYAESPNGKLAGLAHFEAGATSALITLTPTRTFAGEVTNMGGLPAGNLKFYMDLKLNGDTLYRVRRKPTTDEEGKFTVENLCPRALMYAWWHSDNEDNRDYDYGNAEIDLVKLAPEELIRFEAKQYLNTLMGKVVDDQGKPIAKAAIRMMSYNMVQQNERNKQYASDEKGEFEIPRLSSGKVELTITAKGYLTKRFSPESDSFDFEAALRPDTGGRINVVKIVDDDGKPLAGIPVHMWISKRPQGATKITAETLRVLTDKDGVARFEQTPEIAASIVGRSTVECDIEGYDLAYASAGPREELDIVLRIHKSGRHLQGRALDADTGKPIPGATARVKGMRVENSSSFASFPDEKESVFHADSDGVIVFRRFSEKDGISVVVTAPGYAKDSTWLSADRPEDAVFRLSRGGIIIGKLVNTDGGEMPEGFTVLLKETSGNRRVRENISVKEDGSFSWDHCTPGAYTLTATSQSEEGRKLICLSPCETQVKAGQTLNVVIEMEKGTLVCGAMVEAATGKPVSNKEYAYVRTSEGRAYSPVKEDGSWELYLPEGEHKIMYRVKDMKQQLEYKQLTVEKGKPIRDLVIKISAKSAQESEEEVKKPGTMSGRVRVVR